MSSCVVMDARRSWGRGQGGARIRVRNTRRGGKFDFFAAQLQLSNYLTVRPLQQCSFLRITSVVGISVTKCMHHGPYLCCVPGCNNRSDSKEV